DLAVGAHPVGLGAETLDALDEHAPVPRAIEDREAALSRSVAPEAPQVRLRALLFGRRGDRDVRIRARIERSGHAADRAALASRVVAFEHGDDRQLLHARIARQLVEPALPLRELLLVRRFLQ